MSLLKSAKCEPSYRLFIEQEASNEAIKCDQLFAKMDEERFTLAEYLCEDKETFDICQCAIVLDKFCQQYDSAIFKCSTAKLRSQQYKDNTLGNRSPIFYDNIPGNRSPIFYDNIPGNRSPIFHDNTPGNLSHIFYDNIPDNRSPIFHENNLGNRSPTFYDIAPVIAFLYFTIILR